VRRDFWFTGLLWLALTVIGVASAVTWDVLPVAAAWEAHVVDEAFRVLLLLGIPVCAFVLAVLFYSVMRFRRRGEPAEDGPPIHSHRAVVTTWLLVTTALTVLVIIYPGTTGLMKLMNGSPTAAAGPAEELVVQVEGFQWAWKLTYPQHGVTTFNELVLPVGQRVRFEVTSTDVIHAFWVPAFRMKVDALPGRTTVIYATPDRTGSIQAQMEAVEGAFARAGERLVPRGSHQFRPAVLKGIHLWR
jgi:cytochrome c oxidase subunit II